MGGAATEGVPTSPEFARQILDHLDVLVLVVDGAGRLVELNRLAEEQLGRPRAAVLGRPIWTITHPRRRWAEARRTFQPLFDGPFPAAGELAIELGGAERIIRWTLTPIPRSEGEPHRYVVTGTDVTDRTRATRAQRDQLQLLQTLIDTIPNPIYYKATDGTYLGCNRAFELMVGRTRDQIVGNPTRAIHPPALAARYDAADRALFENPGVQVYEAQVRYADGQVHEVIFYKATFADSMGRLQGLVGVVLDITDRKRAEERLAEAHAELEERVRARTAELQVAKDAAEAADRAKTEFLNIAAHELRTPLTALRIALQRAERDLNRGVPVTPQALGRMERYVDRLIRLAADLLDASRLERGLLVTRPVPVDLVELLRSAVDECREVAGDWQLRFEPGSEPLPVEADEDRLAQVFGNLLENAIKYAPPEEPIEVRAERRGGEAVLSFCDRGPGIPAANRHLLFSRFFRLANPLHQPGLGLGLYISREIVERHGGTIRYLPRAGGGSCFEIRLPLRAG